MPSIANFDYGLIASVPSFANEEVFVKQNDSKPDSLNYSFTFVVICDNSLVPYFIGAYLRMHYHLKVNGILNALVPS